MLGGGWGVGPALKILRGGDLCSLELCFVTGIRTPAFALAQAQLPSLQRGAWRGERSREPKVGACTVISGGAWRDMFHPDGSAFLLSQAKELRHQTRGVTDILA